MPINFLQKDCQSSDPVVRVQAIKMLTDMSANLNDIYPFVFDILKGGLADSNPVVVQVSIVGLLKLF